MKVYELIEKLMMIPAGCEVDFYDGAGTIYAVNKVNAPSDCASCAVGALLVAGVVLALSRN